MTANSSPYDGILLIDKPSGRTSFSIVPVLRKRLGIQKIGHAGTLDPFATGLLVFLIGRNYTRLATTFLADDKEYLATVFLGVERDTYDRDGVVTSVSDSVPALDEVENAIDAFQGEQEQIPPMYSAKKVDGKRLYLSAREGLVVERQPSLVHLRIELRRYMYPEIHLRIVCSKGTYIRSLAHDLGRVLGCGAHVSHLRRLRSGIFCVDNALPFDALEKSCDLVENNLMQVTNVR